MVSASKLRRAQERVIGARPLCRADAARAGRSSRPSGCVDPSRCWPCAKPHQTAARSSSSSPPTRGCAALQHQHHQGGGALAAKLRRAGGPSVWLAVRGAISSAAAASRSSSSRSGSSSAGVRERADDRDAGDGAFTSGRADRVLLVYNEFKSVMSQKVVVEQLLPIARHRTTPG